MNVFICAIQTCNRNECLRDVVKSYTSYEETETVKLEVHKCHNFFSCPTTPSSFTKKHFY